ncbi:MAG: hypothetical protein MK358_12100, partial [Vicinamibacterales bacterium]|nr:hypothetical protein [Vicinamibacterales bacterium]
MRTRITRLTTVGLLSCLGLVTSQLADAQDTEATTRFVEVAGGYRLVPNIAYLRAGGLALTLDLYHARG